MHEYAKGVKAMQRAGEICRLLYGEDSEKNATCLRQLSEVQRGNRKTDKAKRLTNAALTIMEQLGLKDTESYGAIVSEMARCHLAEDRAMEALLFFQKALTILLKFKEGKHYPGVLQGMSLCYERLGDLVNGEKYAVKAVEAAKESFGENHPDYAVECENLGTYMFRQQKLKEAVAAFETALKVYRKTLGETHQTTVKMIRLLGHAQQDDDPFTSFHHLPVRRPLLPRPPSLAAAAASTSSPSTLAIAAAAPPASPTPPTTIPASSTTAISKILVKELPACPTCGTKSVQMMMCTQCRGVYYCNRQCQKADWKNHKINCIRRGGGEN